MRILKNYQLIKYRISWWLEFLLILDFTSFRIYSNDKARVGFDFELLLTE